MTTCYASMIHSISVVRNWRFT